MSPVLNFEIAKSYHTEDIVKLVNSAYRGESSRRGWTTEADLLDGQRVDREKVKAMIEAPGASIMIAHLGAELVACVHLSVIGFECMISMVTVRPEDQKKGLGKAVLREAERWARQQGCYSTYMKVLTARADVIAWYERQGYFRTGEFDKFPYGDESFGIPKRQDLKFEILRKRF